MIAGVHAEWMEQEEYVIWARDTKGKDRAWATRKWKEWFAMPKVQRVNDGEVQPDGSRALRMLCPLRDYVDSQVRNTDKELIEKSTKDQKITDKTEAALDGLRAILGNNLKHCSQLGAAGGLLSQVAADKLLSLMTREANTQVASEAEIASQRSDSSGLNADASSKKRANISEGGGTVPEESPTKKAKHAQFDAGADLIALQATANREYHIEIKSARKAVLAAQALLGKIIDVQKHGKLLTTLASRELFVRCWLNTGNDGGVTPSPVWATERVSNYIEAQLPAMKESRSAEVAFVASKETKPFLGAATMDTRVVIQNLIDALCNDAETAEQVAMESEKWECQRGAISGMCSALTGITTIVAKELKKQATTDARMRKQDLKETEKLAHMSQAATVPTLAVAASDFARSIGCDIFNADFSQLSNFGAVRRIAATECNGEPLSLDEPLIVTGCDQVKDMFEKGADGLSEVVSEFKRRYPQAGQYLTRGRAFKTTDKLMPLVLHIMSMITPREVEGETCWLKSTDSCDGG